MPATLPDGEVVHPSAPLTSAALAEVPGTPMGAYVHVPFCSVRCGYCDFNTYTATELGGGASQAAYADTARREIDLLREALAAAPGGAPVLDTVFVGGGTPTLLPAADLARVLDGLREAFGLADGAEITTEANPDSVTPDALAELRAAGFTRVSFGMQSAVPEVLRVLDRTHDPERVPRVVEWARAAGFGPDGGGSLSLDLIYGTPGETPDDWRTSLESALACEPDHVSAYSLIVEEGTALARKVRRGELPMPDEDDLADKYALADDLLGAAGLAWYEVSNWARDEASRCRHNDLYWTSAHWLGIGPGAHAHVGGVRWWNARHPSAWSSRLATGESPAAGHEELDAATRHTERVLLEVRRRAGLPLDLVDRSRVEEIAAEGLAAVEGERMVLTRPGRLLADLVVRRLLA